MVMAGCRHPAPVPKAQEPREVMREILFKDGRLIGQPLSVRQPDVRVVRVESVLEADSIFHAMCLGQKAAVFTIITSRCPVGDWQGRCLSAVHGSTDGA